MTDTYIDFRVIKQRVSMQAVLAHYGIHLRPANQISLRGKCPLPTHQSKTSTDSFGVQTAKNIWACQSDSCAAARQGKKGGNVLDFVAIMENCSIRDAAAKLHEWFLSSPMPQIVPTNGDESAEQIVKPGTTTTGAVGDSEINKPLSFTLKDVDPTHPYVRSRGLTEATARYFEVGFFPGRGSMSGRCVIPIHNDRGELVAYAGRSLDATEPKYKLPAGFKKSDILFNLHRGRLEGGAPDPMIVVEGFFDCMKVSQAGFLHVVALMGSTMSDAQQKLLSACPHVILFLDGDAAGREGAAAIAGRLMYTSFVKVINVPDDKQPDQLSSDELKQILGSF